MGANPALTEFIRGNLETMSWVEMGRALGRNAESLRKYAAHLGMKKPRALSTPWAKTTPGERKTAPAKQDVALAVRAGALVMGVDHAEMFSRRRTQRITRARWIVWALLRPHRNYSIPGLSRVFSRDHTTVIHALRALNSESTANARDLRDKLAVARVLCPMAGVPVTKEQREEFAARVAAAQAKAALEVPY